MKKFVIFLFIISNSPLHAQFCYPDNDGDGYGTPNGAVPWGTFGTCPVIGTWALNGLDCNDNDASINPNTKWYKDLDNDGYTDNNIPLTQCAQPPGYVKTIGVGIDCDDNDPTVTGVAQLWSYDPDGDLYMVQSAQFQVMSICRPLGYSRWIDMLIHFNLDDCNQNDSLEHPNQQWYPDNDGDGYPASTTTIVQCSRPSGHKAASELNSLDIDCNDNDAVLNPGTFWYKDLDNDGYYVGPPVIQCYPPSADYKKTVVGGDDCDDNDPVVHPNQQWVPDNDHDGYQPLVLPIIQCTRPPGYFAHTEMEFGFDCNDNNSSIYPGAAEICDNADNNCNGETDEGLTSLFIQDADGDGAGNPAVFVYACSAPAGYIPFMVGHAGDCNDNNPAIILPKTYYRDADNDGYGEMVGLIFSICSVTAPSGFSANNTDCNDNDAAVHSKYVFYADNDGDGYGAGTSVELCAVSASAAPSGYSVYNTDCNDNNVVMHPATVWYRDTDNDGYSNGAKQIQCTRPAGHKLLSELKPVAASSFGDCDDNNAAIHPETLWYPDADNDGYSNGFNSMTCIRPAGYKLAIELTATSGDCNDNNAMLNPATTWYKDADNDGYSNGATQTQCARPANHKLASELTSITGDCNDADPTVNPASVEVCNNNKDDNCNGSQNEAGCYTCGNATSFSTTNVTYNSATLNWVSIPHPSYWQVQYKSTSPGTRWVDVSPDPAGNLRSVTISGLIPNTNYQWHIKARCGNGWTSNSIAIPFTTPAGATTRSRTNANEEMEASGVTIGSLQVKAFPNPSNTSFRITLNSNNLKEPFKLIISDILGRVIETRSTNAGQIITIGGKYRSGTYVLRIIQGKETRQLKLIKLPD